MKYVLVLLIVIVAAWVMMGRSRGRGRDTKSGGAGRAAGPDEPGASKSAGQTGAAGPQAMVGCTHCGLHLPRSEAVADAQGRLFCGDAHRLAGPR